MTWNRNEQEQALIEFVTQELIAERAEPIDPDQDLLGSGLVNSLGVMRLVRHLEASYAISVPPADVTIEHFTTVRAIVGYVEAQLHGGARAANA